MTNDRSVHHRRYGIFNIICRGASLNEKLRCCVSVWPTAIIRCPSVLRTSQLSTHQPVDRHRRIATHSKRRPISNINTTRQSMRYICRLMDVAASPETFLRATAVPAGTADARTSYGNSVRPSVCPSVRQSVTTRYGFKARWDRDPVSSPYDSLESPVSYEVIWCHWVKRFPSNEGIKEGYTPLEIVILPLLAHLAWKRLQIDTDLLLIITSTADELSNGTNIDTLERPWTPK